MKRIIHYSLIVLFIMTSIISGYALERKNQNKNYNTIEKFNAHREFEKLQKENFKKLKLIEIISKNFGYTDYKKLKKEFWTANILVSQKQIIRARNLLIKNKKDIDRTLEIIAMDYRTATEEMLNDSINKLNEYELAASRDIDHKTRKKIAELRKMIGIASQQYDSAYNSQIDRMFVSSISLYRSAKTYAICILSDLAEPEEKIKINDKFKIHIVDNRNEVYNEG